MQYINQIFETHCNGQNITFSKILTATTATRNGKKVNFTEYVLQSQINPVPATGNIPSHIMIGIEEGGDATNSMKYIRAEKAFLFSKKRIELKEYIVETLKDFKSTLNSVILLKNQASADNLHAALQEYCNDNDIPVDLAKGVGYGGTCQPESIGDQTEANSTVMFSSYEIFGGVRLINGILPENVSFCEATGSHMAELRFNQGRTGQRVIPIKIITVRNVEAFRAALRENLVLDSSMAYAALNAKLDKLTALLDRDM